VLALGVICREDTAAMTVRKSIHVLATIASAGVVAAACRDNGPAAAPATTPGSGDNARARTVEVEMRDIAFFPDAVEVQAGETVRFVFTNAGAVVHDAVVGDEAAQDEHETDMQTEMSEDSGGMDHADNDDESALTVQPGDTGELTHTFAEGDELLIGCHEPGHYDAGMKITVNVG